MNLALKIVLILITFSPLHLLAGGAPPDPIYNSQSTSGDWKTASKWDLGAFPAHNQTNGSHTINITNDHKITLTGILFVKSGTVINVTSNDTLEIIGDVTFANGSEVNVNSGGVLKITGNVTNNNNSNTITIDGLIDIDGNFDGGNGSEINGTGSMDITGIVNTDGSGTVFGSDEDCNTPGTCDNSAVNPLPIDLISFEAYIKENNVDLKWITSTEINNAYFTIERSIDGKEWEEITTVNGAGNSNQIIEYYETDYEPLNGVSYYRLKQTDFDGKFEYFNIIPVKFIKNDYINLYPNPLNPGDVINMNFDNINEKELLIVLKDITGKEFYSKSVVNLDKGKLVNIPTEKGIPTGIYVITVTSKNKVYNQRLVIK